MSSYLKRLPEKDTPPFPFRGYEWLLFCYNSLPLHTHVIHSNMAATCPEHCRHRSCNPRLAHQHCHRKRHPFLRFPEDWDGCFSSTIVFLCTHYRHRSCNPHQYWHGKGHPSPLFSKVWKGCSATICLCTHVIYNNMTATSHVSSVLAPKRTSLLVALREV